MSRVGRLAVVRHGIYLGWRSLAESGLQSLARGDRVTFDVKNGMDGRPYAVNISLQRAEAA
jgi:cold shock CspA family protein